MPNREQVDWEAVEADYRTGQLSVAAIARKHGVSEQRLRKRARENGWQRDLAGQVQQRAAAKDQANIAAEAATPQSESESAGRQADEEAPDPDRDKETVKRANNAREQSRETATSPERPTYRTKGREDDIVEATAEAGAEILRSHRQDLRRMRYRTARISAALDRIVDGEATDTDREILGRDSVTQSHEKLARTLGLLIEKERQAFHLDKEDEQQTGQLAEALTKAKRRVGDDGD